MTTSSLLPQKRHVWDKSCVHHAFLGKGYRCHGPHDLGYGLLHFSLRQLVYIHIFGWDWGAHGGGYKFLSSKRQHVWDRSCVHHAIWGRGTGAMDHIIWDIAISTSHYCKWCIFTDLGGNGVQMSMTTSSLPPKKDMHGTEVVCTLPLWEGVHVPWTTCFGK